MTKTRQYTIFRMLQYLKELWGYMALNCLICMVYELLPLVNMFLLSYMITSLLDGAAIGYDRMLGVLLLSVVLQSAFGYLNMWTEHDIAYRLLYKLRFEIYCRLEKAIPSFRREISTAEMTSIVTNDMNLLEWFYAHTVNIFVVSAAVFLGIMVFFYSIHPLFAANAVLWMGLYLLTPVIFRKKSFEDGKAIRESYGKLSGVMMDSIQGMREIISFNFWSEYKKRIFCFVDRYDKSKQVDGKRRALEWMYTLLVMSMMNTLALLISVYVAKAPEEQRWIMVVFIVGSSVFTVFNKFIAMSTQFSSIFAAARRVFDLLNLPVQVEDSGEEVFSEKIESIEFRNVSFS